MVMEWRLTATAPRTTARAMTAFGTKSSVAQNVPSSRAIPTRVPPSRAAWARCAAAASGPRPSALSTRTPVAASSTSVVRSPSWSCARRASTL